MAYEDLIGAAMRKQAWAEGHRPRLPENNLDKNKAGARTRFDAGVKPRIEAILKILPRDEYKSQPWICQHSGVYYKAVRDVLRRMEVDGLIVSRRVSERQTEWKRA